MTVMQGILLLKTLLDFVCFAGFAYDKEFPLALMFFGFAVADAGALCIGMDA